MLHELSHKEFQLINSLGNNTYIFLPVETMEVLIGAGADVNAQNHIAKMTPLHCAIRYLQ